jgi:4-methyl-5(b-hydroxyethyl)-thiazole monophosphate biosynthesis
MIYIYLAEGYEETEMLFPLDLMRRAGLDVYTVSVTGKKEVTGSHGITVMADMTVSDPRYDLKKAQLIMLPGGMPGSLNLEASAFVQEALRYAQSSGIYVAAICAAPMVLGRAGLLKGKKAVCYPGFEKYLLGALPCNERCVVDGKIITAIGCGAACELGLAIVAELCGKEKSMELKNGILA